MLEILAIVAVLLAAHKKPSRRRMRRYVRGKVDEELGLPTLGAKSVVSDPFDENVNERSLVTSIIARYSLQGLTPATADGPILVGIAHSDYTSAEIEEWQENTGSWDEGNKISQEIGRRKIRSIGIFPGVAAASEAVVLNNGKPIKTKLNWILNQGTTLRLWAYNLGSSPLATTTPVINVDGHVNLFPT